MCENVERSNTTELRSDDIIGFAFRRTFYAAGNFDLPTSFYFGLLSVIYLNKSIGSLKLLHFQRYNMCRTASISQFKNLRLTAFSRNQKMHFPCSSFCMSIARYSRFVLNAKYGTRENFPRDYRFSKISRDYSERDRINRDLARRIFRFIPQR